MNPELTIKTKRSSAVILSKRANVFYLEHAKVMQEGDRIVYLTDSHADVEQMFNIPDKNTAFILKRSSLPVSLSSVRFLSLNRLSGTTSAPLATQEPR